MVWESGQSLHGGTYQIKETLGYAGFGITYKALHASLGRYVVIKTPDQRQKSDRTYLKYVERFVKEAKLLTKVCVHSHPHIVRVSDFFKERDTHCLVMDFVDGESLLDLVQSRGALPETEAIEYIRQIGDALSLVHKAGLVHRDAHPGNIMFRNSGMPVLINFGIARDCLPTSSSNSLPNKTFAPYELMSEGSDRPTVDIYTLAASLYYAVTGQRPVTSFARKQEGAFLVPPQQHNPSISDRLNRAIIQGMELEAKDRPQTLQQWLELLPESGTGSFLKFFQFDAITVNPQGRVTNCHRHEAKFFVENLGNGVILEMVSIPGGTFQMGTPDLAGNDYEHPQHLVTVAPFFMGKYPVTQAQWTAVATLPQINIPLNPEPSSFIGANLPVEQVSWYDAQEFCARLSKKTGRIYRLPSEAEWEYACRAGTTTPFHFGGTITFDFVNYDSNFTFASEPKKTFRQETTPVGSFPPNAFGLYDMHGNVWEWCADFWHDNYQGAPSDGSVWEEGGDNKYRVLRGGSWYFYPWNCRSAFRYRSSPDGWVGGIGFRVVCASESSN